MDVIVPNRTCWVDGVARFAVRSSTDHTFEKFHVMKIIEGVKRKPEIIIMSRELILKKTKDQCRIGKRFAPSKLAKLPDGVNRLEWLKKRGQKNML